MAIPVLPRASGVALVVLGLAACADAADAHHAPRLAVVLMALALLVASVALVAGVHLHAHSLRTARASKGETR